MLASPNFLFRIEGPAADQYALASKLSYFLWSSMPDEEFIACGAEKGTVRNPEVLSAEARRMLADRKASALVENFAGQWLEIRPPGIGATGPGAVFPISMSICGRQCSKKQNCSFSTSCEKTASILDFIDGPYSFLTSVSRGTTASPGFKDQSSEKWIYREPGAAAS